MCIDDDEFQLRKNPFKIPSDIDIFLLRDKERERAKAVCIITKAMYGKAKSFAFERGWQP